MKEQLNEIRQKAISRLENSDTLAALEELRLQFLGKKGEVTALLKQMGKLSPEERPVMGQLANQVRSDIEEMLAERKQELEAHALDAKLKAEAVDVTIPGDEMTFGHQHPMNQVLQEIKDIFTGMGYQIVDGPEVELAEYNFTRLNIEEGHPSRDRSDTFYFTDDDSLLLRPRPAPCRSGSWRTPSLPSASWPPAGCTGKTRPTPPTPPCSIRSRAWWWMRASPWAT